MADTRGTEKELRTDEALTEMAGGPEKSGVAAKPGIYGADGDPWSYKVGEGGDIMVKSGGGDWMPAPGAALSAIEAQIKSGQLSKTSETEPAEPVLDDAAGAQVDMSNPFADLDTTGFGAPNFDPKAARDLAAEKALGTGRFAPGPAKEA
jgi:hypothetical protein